MTKKESLQLFEEKKVRTVWDDKEEKWYFSIVDVCGVLTEQPDTEHARNYWKVLKHRLVKEGNQTVTNCNRLKLRASDGKLRMTDVADTEQLFRIIQSIPSPKAEPFKVWMAQVASSRLEQMQDPEKSIDQAIVDYKRLGYSDAWIICFSYRHHYPRVEWNDNQTVQEFQRSEEGKPARQYDQHGDSSQYACRGICHGVVQTAQP